MVKRTCCGASEAYLVEELGVDFAATRRALGTKKLSNRAKNIICQIATGTYPIGRYMEKIGVPVLNTCPFCKRATDTLEHRLWERTELSEQRARHFTEATLAWAKRGGHTTRIGQFSLATCGHKLPKLQAQATQRCWGFDVDGAPL